MPPEQIRADLQLISQLTRNVRTYSVQGTLAQVPDIALSLDMSVTLGVWISRDDARNLRELATAVALCNRLPNITRLIIGNEALYRGDVTVERLIALIELARQQVKIPVSASEIWVQWLETPTLADHTDFIAAHVLPFWEAVSEVQVGVFVTDHAMELRRAFPGKPVIVTEVGWPSRYGAARRSSGSAALQSICLRQQTAALENHGFQYFVIEAFDQPWKTEEGVSGAHWGVFSADRRLKLQHADPVALSPEWQAWQQRGISRLQPRSWRQAWLSLATIYAVLLCTFLHAANTLPVWIALPLSALWTACMLVCMAVESHEFLEACWSRAPHRSFPPQRLTYEQLIHWPKVSIHVPCCNEPPDMVMATLDSLDNMDYPDFEVLVFDNNTPDPRIWRPVRRHCARLGKRFRFCHIRQLRGFKAGALNMMLDHTTPDAEIIAVVDADYQVDRSWLKHMVPHFRNLSVAVVQSPQDYRDARESLFKRCCQAEYQGFFRIGMVLRNDYNAIIQHGTMTLIRRAALQKLRWAPWSICEDAELGLRMLEHGFATGYSPVSYGKGLIPDTFADFKKQRYRWAYGAVQIVKRHSAFLITGREPALTAMQRYHFIAGWVPWAAHGVTYVLCAATLAWSMAMIVLPERLSALPWPFSASLSLMFILWTLKIAFLYRRLVSSEIREALQAILAGIALYPTIGKAVLFGLYDSGLPFFRTPKQAARSRCVQALLEAREEMGTALMTAAVTVGLALAKPRIDMELAFWLGMLWTQTLPHLAALGMAVLSTCGARKDFGGKPLPVGCEKRKP